MRKELTPPERLIVAADFDPTDEPHGASLYTERDDVRDQVMTLAKGLQGTGVIIKVNSALRACGYGLIDDLHSLGLRVFADLKLADIPETLTKDGRLLAEAKPELLTVYGPTGKKAMKALKDILPGTEVLGVTVLTSFDESEIMELYGTSVENVVELLAEGGMGSGLDGFVCSPKEVKVIRGLDCGEQVSINTPAIRPAWAVVKGDDQNKKRSATPAEAIQAGADRIVVGRPITQADDPLDAVKRTLDEIAAATMK